ncbi:MAG: hypothetical protein CSA75_05500 [Sorangium cellulosum]|nr:MAG: hypothetical protein CSA75_05500 [Sorangium cellulosum]
MALRSNHIAVATSLLIAAWSCAPPPPKTVSIRVKGGMSNATVRIDEVYIGSFGMVKQRGVALPPGKHRITIEKSGYFPWDKQVDVKEGDPMIILDVDLKRIPD